MLGLGPPRTSYGADAPSPRSTPSDATDTDPPSAAMRVSRRARRSSDLTRAVLGGRPSLPAAESASTCPTDAAQLLRSVGRPEGQLARAVVGSDAETVEGLLVAGALTNASDALQPGWTPLHAAVERGCVRIVKLLLAHGADTRARDELTGTTPLLWASFCGQAECVAALLEWGGPSHVDFPQRLLDKDVVGRSALALARLKQVRI